MRKTMTVLAMIAMASGSVGRGTAQLTSNYRCLNKVTLQSVTQAKVNATEYEYSFTMKNDGAYPYEVSIQMGKFPSTVDLFSPKLMQVPLAAHASKTIKFGRGTDATINNTTVDRLYDNMLGYSKPFVALYYCGDLKKK